MIISEYVAERMLYCASVYPSVAECVHECVSEHVSVDMSGLERI